MLLARDLPRMLERNPQDNMNIFCNEIDVKALFPFMCNKAVGGYEAKMVEILLVIRAFY